MDIDPKLDRYGELLLTIGGILSSIAAFLYAIYRFCNRHIKNLFKAIRLSNDIHSFYGSDPARIIHDILFNLQRDSKETQIVQKFITKTIRLPLYVCDEQGNYTWVNDEVCELFGLDSEDMHGSKWLQAIDDKDRIRVWEEWQRCVTLKIPYSAKYNVNNTRTDTVIPVQTVAMYIKISDNRAFYVGCVTEIKEN